MSGIDTFRDFEPKQKEPQEPLEWIFDKETPLKIKGILKNKRTKIFLLLPSKDKSYWQFVNLDSGFICLCRFKTKQKAIEDLMTNYSDKYENLIFYKQIL